MPAHADARLRTWPAGCWLLGQGLFSGPSGASQAEGPRRRRLPRCLGRLVPRYRSGCSATDINHRAQILKNIDTTWWKRYKQYTVADGQMILDSRYDRCRYRYKYGIKGSYNGLYYTSLPKGCLKLCANPNQTLLTPWRVRVVR